MFLTLPNFPGGGAQLVPSRVSVVFVEGTIAEDTPGRGCPGEDHEMLPLANTRKPSSETVLDDDSRSPCGGGGLCPLPLLPGGSFRLMLHPWETLSPVFYKNLEPLEHSVPEHAGPAGRHIAVGPVGPFRTLSSSDCHPAGPAGPYVAGGPVGPDIVFQVLEQLEHSVLDHADPPGWPACCCWPCGPV